MSTTLWATILGMFVATFLIRASFLVFGQRLRFPPAVIEALGHVPVAVLSAIVIPEAIAPGGQLNLSLANPYLVGTLIAGLIAWKTGRLLVAVIVSFAVFGAMRWLL
ncbi:AzlD domain-containing protein [Propionivibrio soli]|jgi:branched-subunit amino acid transport protein|uniref:AzlD domain-containing protein n=1 Tax=Propionivibrio soli TaxID=2976531 RepID=UPI0021E93753|nr:AzlD domain-containing protein [Propionivibrio soli]